MEIFPFIIVPSFRSFSLTARSTARRRSGGKSASERLAFSRFFSLLSSMKIPPLQSLLQQLQRFADAPVYA